MIKEFRKIIDKEAKLISSKKFNSKLRTPESVDDLRNVDFSNLCNELKVMRLSLTMHFLLLLREKGRKIKKKSTQDQLLHLPF